MLLARFARGSLAYTLTVILQKGTAYLLVPIYTRYLVPDQYGVIAVVTAINALIMSLSSMSLHGAVTRFYFDNRTDQKALQEFWGTVFTAVGIGSVAVGITLFLFGPFLLRPLMGSVPFMPYIALGIAVTLFQPLLTSVLSALQAEERRMEYALLSLGQVTVNATIGVSLVVLLGWGAEGPLAASLVAAAAFALIGIVVLRKELKFGLSMGPLREALKYSLPLVPHNMSGQVMSVTDRLFVNGFVGASGVGVYSIAVMMGSAVSLLTDSLNRAYVPVAMDARKRADAESISDLHSLEGWLVVVFLLGGTFVSIFAREIVELLTVPDYYEAARVVPYLAFSATLVGVYYVLANVLFFETGATRLVALATIAGATSNVVLNALLVPGYGLVGAAAATLLGQGVCTTIAGVLGARLEPFRRSYWKLVLAFVVCFGVSLAVIEARLTTTAVGVLIRVGLVGALGLLLSRMFWSDWLYPIRLVWTLRSPRNERDGR